MSTFNTAYLQAAQAYSNAVNMPVKLAGSAEEASESGVFSGLIRETLGDTAKKLRQTEAMSNKALVNEADITDVVTSVSEAEIALQEVVALRDRMISAYQDIIKMPV